MPKEKTKREKLNELISEHHSSPLIIIHVFIQVLEMISHGFFEVFKVIFVFIKVVVEVGVSSFILTGFLKQVLSNLIFLHANVFHHGVHCS
jgi:K+-sensing histidine kinase KdpD